MTKQNKRQLLAELAGEMDRPEIQEVAKPLLDLAGVVPEEPEVGRSMKGTADNPQLSDGIRALLVMTNCRAQWAGNHWHVQLVGSNRDVVPPGTNAKTYRCSTGVSANATFEEWRTELRKLGGAIGP